MNNDMNNNLNNTHNFKLLINCKKTLNIIEYVSLAFYAPTLIYYLFLGLENSKAYAPALFKTLVQLAILYFMLELIKRGHKIPAVLLLIFSLLSFFFMVPIFKIALKNPLLLYTSIFYLCKTFWTLGSMIFVLFTSDMKNYFNYINTNN